ncbi:LacI family transcriptional regulator [Kroppenstedtia pulmonis]|uniref:LacI family transcriptional regulator n=1 Tax=Kroppenstedtia pulmonis TaxID=1380685 RepID=A0A7D3XPU4_9BACL|nr:LacI family DNA-binding transcriptional regulator [Kroppenstedtia pulmonis]QKG83822.1 LacI family transcriptional regulator [Kroppenstedtia pulmonis]
MATIRDVARCAGVSVATVSRVINQSGYVNKDTEARVNHAIQMLHYEPNPVARGLASRKTGTIAVILPDIMNPFFSELARAVEDTALVHKFAVIFCNSDDQGSKERSYIQVLRQRYIDGIIFASNSLEEEDIQLMKDHNIPLVVMDRAPSKGNCSIIRSKNAQGARLAVNHLLQVGCRKIAHIAGPDELITAQKRRQGYLDIVGELDWFDPTLVVPGHFSITGGIGAAQALMEYHPDIDGIFAGNDLMAVGALKALNRMGVSVPSQVALCGFDGVALSEMVEPELTTVAQPIYEMGAKAAFHLINQIKGIQEEQTIIEMDIRLIQRDSTKRSRKR